jgi:hypothetical protein
MIDRLRHLATRTLLLAGPALFVLLTTAPRIGRG